MHAPESGGPGMIPLRLYLAFFDIRDIRILSLFEILLIGPARALPYKLLTPTILAARIAVIVTQYSFFIN
jgi:hypothetical protein